MNSAKQLTAFKLIMMAVVAIDSVKNLPFNALYGSHLIIYYVIAIVAFFMPSALISAELATAWPAVGGVYIWVREAFNKQIAFLGIWLQWLVAIIWYPSILSFIAATLAYLYSPELALNKMYIYISIQALFWGATYLVGKGLHLSSWVSTLSAIIGVILPMVIFILLGFSWIYSGHPSQINLMDSLSNENMISMESLRLFITLLYSLMGIEVIAAHAGDVKNPQKNYPIAIFIATGIILITVIPSSLAIAIVVPHEKISLTTGVIEAFIIFLKAFHLDWAKSFLIIALAIGSFGIFLNWLLATTRYLMVAAKDDSLPAFLLQTNRYGMPSIQLALQGLIFSILSSAFIFMPSVNSAFWLLSVVAAQFALLYYLFLFTSALRLHFKYPHVNRPFKAGKHPLVFRAMCTIAAATCLSAFVFGFIPPPEINQDQFILYEFLLSGLIILGCSMGLIIHRLSQPVRGDAILNQ